MKKVVIVEDCTDLRELYRFALARESYQVEVFRDAESLSQKLALGYHADLLICDIGLPGMPGDEFIRTFRGLNRNPSARIVVISGLENLQSLSQRLGADSYLKKPFSLAVLKKSILEELNFIALK